MTADADEIRRREEAYEHRGEVDGPGESIESKSLDQVISIRLDAGLAATLRDMANERDITVSALLREAARKLVELTEPSDVIDVEAEDVTPVAVPAEVIESIGTMPTPDLPVPVDDVDVRTGYRRVDALRLGDELTAPVIGHVTGLIMEHDGQVWVWINAMDPPYLVPGDEACLVVLPWHRPGEPAGDDAPMLAQKWAQLEYAQQLVEQATS